jgi:CBS-domain-containing membrane protein
VKIRDVMTTDVLTVRPDATLKDVARMLSAAGISGVPVTTEEGELCGVVSEADILAKERRPPEDGRGRRRQLGPASQAKAEARTAADAMTAPAITIAPGDRVDAAAALMLDCGVNRLPVLEDGRLVGIVTRADLVRAFAASDERIEREIRDVVLLRELWLDPREFDLRVEDGVVEIAGKFDAEDQREIVAQRLRLVPGVVSVAVREAVAAR